MAAANAFVLLSSSPLQPTTKATLSKQHASTSSSSPLPSPSQLLSRKTCNTNSAMERNSLPKEAIVSFKSASGLLRRSQSADESICSPGIEQKVAEASPMASSAKEPIMKKARRPAKDKMEPMKVKKPKASATKAPSARKKSTDVVGGGMVAEPPDKKSRDPAQTKIKKSKITKVGSVNGPFGDSQLKTEAKSRKIDKESTEPLAEAKEAASCTCSERQDLCLEDATRRRNNWTPVKDTGHDFMMINDEMANTRAPLDQGMPATSKGNNYFENLLGDYGYTHTNASLKESSEVSRNPTGEALTKRRKVEV